MLPVPEPTPNFFKHFGVWMNEYCKSMHSDSVENSDVSTKQTVCTGKRGEKDDQEIQAINAADTDEVVINPDLMCVVCERPDDEANMLVCDCKRGYHIYCLTPPLDSVPEGDWHCPHCVKK